MNDDQIIIQAVKDIKQAILSSQYEVAKIANARLLSLYFGVGKYVSVRSRNHGWGTGVIDGISERLHRELPGLHGFSAPAIRKMRIFYEQWQMLENCSPAVNELSDSPDSVNSLSLVNRSLVVNNLDIHHFLSVSFTHHYEILAKATTLEERAFYITKTAEENWSKDDLILKLKQDLFHHQEYPNNFSRTIPDKISALKAISTFKDNYLLDFINTEELNARDAAYLGQLSAYLRILDTEVKKPHENPSIGIVLCKTANKPFVEFLIQGYNNPMGVATYKTESDVRKVLPREEDLKQLLNSPDTHSTSNP